MKFNIAFTTGDDVPEHTHAAYKKQKDKASSAHSIAMLASVAMPFVPKLGELLERFIHGDAPRICPGCTAKVRAAAEAMHAARGDAPSSSADETRGAS